MTDVGKQSHLNSEGGMRKAELRRNTGLKKEDRRQNAVKKHRAKAGEQPTDAGGLKAKTGKDGKAALKPTVKIKN